MRKLLLSVVLIFAARIIVAQNPVLGTYPATTIASAGGNTIITPSTVPTNTINVTAFTSADFKGLLHANPATGALTITNAHPAGVYSITIKSFNGVSTATATCLLTVNNPLCSQTNFTGSDIFASGAPLSITVGDFNNDGKQDFATANYANNVIVRLGNGMGGFTTGAFVSVGGHPGSIGIGDFNGDGKQDFVVAIPDSNRISFFLGDGSGGFSISANVSVGVGPQSLVIGDFNSDGKQDIATANYYDSSISVCIGDGAGSFITRTSVSVGRFPAAIVIGDFNRDGKPDFAVPTFGNSGTSICLGDGSGGFSITANASVGGRSLTIGDFNGDGKQDLITVGSNGLTCTTHVSFGDGAGGFSETPTVGGAYTPFTPWRSITGDFNGDGKQDIAIAGVRGANGAVIIGTGDGTGHFFFTAPVVAAYASESQSIMIGDFNGDGRHDFVVGSPISGIISVRLNTVNDINVKGNNTNIANGDTTPDTTDYTDFSIVTPGSSLAHTYTIQNTGTANLTVNSITLTGTGSLSFIISGISFPATVPAGASATFTLRFAPTTGGVKNARVNISSNDCDESIYDFTVKGMAVCTSVSGNNVWLGTTTDWNLPGNWSLGVAPTACTRVVVNGGVPFMPQVTAENSACYSLTLHNGATVTVKTGGHLNITATN